MRDLNPDLQSLVDAARAADVPRPEDRERVRRALAAQLGGAALLASTAATGSASAAGATSTVAVAAGATATGLSTKLVVVALLVAGGAGTAALTRGTHGPRGATVTAPAALADRPAAVSLARREASAVRPVTEALLPVAPPAIVPVAPRREHVAPPPARPARGLAAVPPREEVPGAAPTGSLVDEVSLLRAAQGALRGGEAARSLDLLAQHASRFPSGAMREERLALRVAALCGAGRRSEARAAAEQFEREAPRSVLGARVRASCAGTSASAVDSITDAAPSPH